ncbi:uncharacterized protein LOC127103239 [Lathyrus oleraceus]|uniref:uncharacterized protein LOC127103239 n=1 Tax=Pisum sativum TaxID=3888 RepID=UPI0021CE6514|nr:uncharacterized protein LOC127103239 [Pisum sativum]
MSDSSSSESCNPNREYPVSDSANTSHARRPKETVSGFSLALALDEQTREGSRYVHNSIATLVTGILSGNHKVLGVSVPLNTIVPENVACQENTVSLEKNVPDEAEQNDVHEGSNIDKRLENVGSEAVRVTHDVSDNPKADTVNLEEFSDNELLALERELDQNVLECKEIVDLIQEAGLMKTVTQLSKCYETLVKEFIVNVSEECVDGKSREFRKVYVRGKCVNFSPSIINMYLGRPDVAQPELEVTDNTICQVITANQVRKWPLKGETSSVGNQQGKVAVIAILRETCKELEARKLTLENLIIKLEMSNGGVLGEPADATEGAARQSAEGEEDASPDDGTDDEADSESDD